MKMMSREGEGRRMQMEEGRRELGIGGRLKEKKEERGGIMEKKGMEMWKEGLKENQGKAR